MTNIYERPWFKQPGPNDPGPFQEESIEIKVPEFYEGYRTALINMLDHVRKHGKDDLIKWTEAALFGVTKP